MIQVEMLSAGPGDCFLITLVEDDFRILIDGGTAQTYERYLKPGLLQLSKQGKAINLLVVTHTDNDHIGGIIELFKENGCSSDAKIIPVDEVWYNSYRHLSMETALQAGFREKVILQDIISNRSVRDWAEGETGAKQISAAQGTTLAGLLYKGKYNWNSLFFGNAVSTDFQEEIQISKNAVVKLLSPTGESIDRLRKLWAEELKKNKYDFQFSKEEFFDDAYEYYFRYLRETAGSQVKIAKASQEEQNMEQMVYEEMPRDTSPTNNASIAFVLKSGEKKLLFSGDLCADLLQDTEQGIYDLIKIPHHGSGKNITRDFLKKYKARNYLISTDGSLHQHPNAGVIAKIMPVSVEGEKRIFFNYYHEDIEKIFPKEVQEKYHCKLVFPNDTGAVCL